jgi:PAS domain S-box-containing protein
MYSLHALAPDAAPPGPDDYMALVHPDDRAAVGEVVERAMATGGSFDTHYRIVRPDGDVRSLHCRGDVEVDADGRAVRLLGSCHDITDRLQTLAALRVSEERYRLLRRATHDLIWDLDPATGTMTVDESAFGALRHPRPEPSDTRRWWERHIHPDDAERVVGSLRDVLENGGDVWEAEYRFLRGDGSYAELADNAHVLRDADGRAMRVVGAARDVTERRALESRLRDAQRMEAVGQLAGGIAHDFNNLLTVISANTMFVRGEVAPDGQAAADLDRIDEASRRAADLTRQLLAFGRRQILHPRRVDLNAMVAGLAEAARRTKDADVRIETRLAPHAWPAHADPEQLERVLLDLVANARHGMPAGGTIRITTANVEVDGTAAREHPARPAGSYVSLTVEDTGTGIPPALLPHIFEPFATTREAGRGAGLGLATVHGIVTQSGGHVEARGTPGAGTTITVLLPRAEGSVPATTPRPARKPEGGHETVLLVEDEPAVRASLGRVLARRGYNVVEAANGEEALRIWHGRQEHGTGAAGSDDDGPARRIDLVLTDLVMPVLGGRLLVERLRAAQPDVRVVLMSGYTADSTEVPAVLDGTGRSAFLQKPIRPDVLLRTVRHVIEDHPPPDADTGGGYRREATSGRNGAAGGEGT